jgi:hypothetical protein
MNWDGRLPDDWFGVAGLLIVGLVVLVLAQGIGGGLIFKYHHDNNKAARRDRRQLADATAEIKEQVVNGHSQIGLRDDLDRIRADIHTIMGQLAEWSPVIGVVRSLTEDVKGLRQDIAEERDSRRNLAADVRADMARNRDEVSDLHRKLRDATG